MSQIVVFPRGQLSDADRAILTEAGVVAVEADDPSKVVTVLPGAPLATPNDLTMAALSAVAACPMDSTHRRFVVELHRRIARREEKLNG
ncbi:hypothetical protein OCJ37_14565 [Xanthomonas sp. AM6]|uniref:hypothetical protein n=1 Tax=Xanthomonas sp. AM6 TaxID=2982531 RepID=UPI0021D886DD|nr:hypothetical protein [Xanthomonas sp. AM6]UYB51209.1 hypothetical protein OCJ37_14565 [Xanthomonas sp. AM6]